MTTQSYVAAFRAYEWSPDIAELAERFFSACPGARHVVLLNEANGPIDIGPYEKVAHTEDFSEFGFPEYPPGQSLYLNSDYAFVLLYRRLPGFAHYVICESDVAVNLSLDPMMREAQAGGLDAILHRIQPCQPDWYFHEDALVQEEPWRAYIFLGVFSAQALDALDAGRRHLAALLSQGRIARWPMSESFVPTVLRAEGMRLAELGDFADVADLNYRPRMSIRDPRANRPGSLAHAVLGTDRFIELTLRNHPPSDYGRPGTELHEALAAEPLDVVWRPLQEAFLLAQDHAGLARLHASMRDHGLDVPLWRDLAFGKPAATSSLSPWSHHQDVLLEGAGANGLVLHEDCGFHTGDEAGAWWMVDLLDEFLVEQVCIVNRRGPQQQRFRTFSIDSSRDGAAWLQRYAKLDQEDVSSDPESPWTLFLADPFLARYVRVRLLGTPDHLHLSRVQVFGRRLVPESAA